MKLINSKTKTLTLAGLIFLGATATNTNAQYSQGGWKPVTENEFNRLKIPEDSIQAVDLIKNKDSSRYTDNSKRGKKFTDMNGEKYFWVNPNPTGKIYSFDRGRQKIEQPKYQTKKENLLDNSKVKEKLTEAQQLEALINDSEIKNLIKDFNSSFQIGSPYAYLGEDIIDKKGRVLKKGQMVFFPQEIQDKYQKGIILYDKKTLKQVLVINRNGLDLGQFLSGMVLGIDFAIQDILFERDNKNRGKELTTFEERKKFIMPYFTDSIHNAIKNLPKYEVPIIYKWKNEIDDITKYDIKKGIKPIDMNEQKLDEILKEGEK